MIENMLPFLGRPTLNNNIEEDWEEFETNFQIALPHDYKTFTSAYGPGQVRGHVIFFHPKAPRESESLSLSHEIEETADSYRDIRALDPSLVPWPIYPEPGWLIPIAREIRGDQLLLRVGATGTSNPSLILDWHHGWHEYSMSFTEFMEAGLSGTLDPPFFFAETNPGVAGFFRLGRVES
ncbi:SMI1/KNR4 family protein [Streptomyces sp. SID3343]|uniref:SMI1/KNR4 family protein n=1 Tax=Streptomyces sp. SID3343 TaxID=2690260 RepID=UPI00136FEBBE|nr:SMI1/KNR4 family protein [Streptomyces sp. SID3343]MYW00353.1 hypothetical protein [Streptomyces sp. SID3343]